MSKKKKRIRSDLKGKRGERALLGPLSNWWGFDFHRTPSSGAWGTQHDNQEFSQDIICDDPNFPFDIEVKHQENWNLEKLLTSDKTPIYKWWEQAVRQCAPNKKPMLCFKKNRHPFLVITKETDTPADLKGPFFTLYPENEEDECLDIYLFEQLLQCNITQWLK